MVQVSPHRHHHHHKPLQQKPKPDDGSGSDPKAKDPANPSPTGGVTENPDGSITITNTNPPPKGVKLAGDGKTISITKASNPSVRPDNMVPAMSTADLKPEDMGKSTDALLGRRHHHLNLKA